MGTQIYVNLPVRDLARSKQFFAALGYQFNAQFSNDQGACMIVAGDIYVMLLVESFFKTFTHKPVIDARHGTEVLVCLSMETRQQLDDMVTKALAAGATAPRAPQDHGFMYQHGFEDLDGHIWELVHMSGAPG
jgi:uncharacterized protein